MPSPCDFRRVAVAWRNGNTRIPGSVKATQRERNPT